MRIFGVVLVLLVTASPAIAWSPGPYDFQRCVDTFEVAVHGTVSKVEVVDKKAGGWVLSRAHLRVKRAYFGIPRDLGTLPFYFWSQTDNTLTLKHELAVNDQIVVFLSRNLEPAKGMKTDTSTSHMLQFAKANHRGYLYKLVRTHGDDILHDAIFFDDPKLTLTLTAAEALLAKRKP